MVDVMLHAIEDKLGILQVSRRKLATFPLPGFNMLLWRIFDFLEGWSVVLLECVGVQIIWRLREWGIGAVLEAFEKLSLSAGFICIVFPLVQHAFHVEPVVEIPHLIQESPRSALLQFLLDLFGDVVQFCILIFANDMCLPMGMRSAVLLVLIAHL